MRNFLKMAVFGFAFLGLAACGDVMEVPPAYVGKIKTPAGWQEGVVEPSQFRMNATCFIAPCDTLYLAEISNFAVKEEIKLFMPKDQLNMDFDIRMTLAVKSDADSVNQLFSKITADRGVISGIRVYDTYAKQVVRSVARQVMAEHSINEVASSREAISAKLAAAVNTAILPKPIKVIEFGLSDVQFPEIIVNAKEKAAQREAEIAEQDAANRKRISKLKADLEAEKQQRAIKRERAEAVKEVNEIYAQSVSEGYIKWQMLEVLEKMADNDNAVFVPLGALDDMGLSNRIFRTGK